MLARCSSLYKLMTEPKTKADKDAGLLSQTAKSYVYEQWLFDRYGFDSFKGNKYTEQGNVLEDEAIIASGNFYGRFYMKNERRVANNLITGECDIYDPANSLIIDTKNSWSIGTHPFLQEHAEAKTKECGYDWQGQGYMWLYDVEHYEVHYHLFPCPAECLGKFDDTYQLIDLVERIPAEERLTIVRFNRDEEKIKRIQEQCEKAQRYYEELNKLVKEVA